MIFSTPFDPITVGTPIKYPSIPNSPSHSAAHGISLFLSLRYDSAISIDGAALLGDAAGLVDPLSGEGIFAALQSGMAVAPIVEQYLSSEVDSLAGYQLELQKQLIPEIETSEALMQIFHTYPRPFVWMLQHVGMFWIGAIELIRGGSTYLDLINKFGRIGQSLLRPAAWLGDKISARRRI